MLQEEMEESTSGDSGNMAVISCWGGVGNWCGEGEIRQSLCCCDGRV